VNLAKLMKILHASNAPKRVLAAVIAAYEAEEAEAAAEAEVKQEHVRQLTAERVRRHRERNALKRDVTDGNEVQRVTERYTLNTAPIHAGGVRTSSLRSEDSDLTSFDRAIACAPADEDFPDLLGNPIRPNGHAHPKKPKPTNAKPAYHRDFEALLGCYPSGPPSHRPKQSYDQWLRLPEEDRDKVIDAALAYAVQVERERAKKGPDTPCRALWNWLSHRDFDEILEQIENDKPRRR
jgi:hypothetical protein